MTQSTSSSKQNGKAPTHTPDPEVVPRATRRQFSAAYKRRIVAEADACTERVSMIGLSCASHDHLGMC